MLSINPKDLEIPQLHRYLLGAIGPRPIAFASTIDTDGVPNLSPFSFFNVFSANPPILIFSPARSGRTGATKNTLDNVQVTKEVVINVVNYDIVQQMSLSSSPYDPTIDEFVKAGLTPVAAEDIRPFRVKESPVQFECKVNEIVALGQHGGAGNLVICEVLKIHINEAVLDAKGMIDQQKIDLVSRMGGNWYCRADKNAMFEIQKPITSIGVGVDQLPAVIRNSAVLSGNDLGLLGSVETIPVGSPTDSSKHKEAKELLAKDDVEAAWKVLLS
jgi:flavin reductase (DIM6/NTAB) family NADH-FMN oxidoreductase RutF